MMCYNSDKTFLIQFRTRDKTDEQTGEVLEQGEVIDKIIKIPRRLIAIYDFENNFGQIILEHFEDFSDIQDKDIAFVCVCASNDPYCEYAGGIVNLGYYCLRWRFVYGKILSWYPLIFATNSLDDSIFTESIPLRVPNKINGDSHIRFIEDNQEAYHLIDYLFEDNLDKDYHIKYGFYDYDEEKGYSVTRKQNILSAYNKAETLNRQEITSREEILKLHGLFVDNKK